MQVRCTNCLHLKKVPGKLSVFCKMEKLPHCYDILRSELTRKGVIRLTNRKIFDFAKGCPAFVNMQDEDTHMLFKDRVSHLEQVQGRR